MQSLHVNCSTTVSYVTLKNIKWFGFLQKKDKFSDKCNCFIPYNVVRN